MTPQVRPPSNAFWLRSWAETETATLAEHWIDNSAKLLPRLDQLKALAQTSKLQVSLLVESEDGFRPFDVPLGLSIFCVDFGLEIEVNRY